MIASHNTWKPSSSMFHLHHYHSPKLASFPGPVPRPSVSTANNKAGVRRAGVRRAGVRRAGVRRAGVRRAGVRRAGVRRAGVRRAGVRRAGVRRAGVRRAGVRRAGVRRPGGGEATTKLKPLPPDKVSFL